ncbi:hypothetical protein [Aquisphaera insulae]|uniref:hypothetical protein n=1 Tax=Aquisphaera insulae TaxID=2712864 RepID=UPI0013EAD58E|nr:hypothetical protein [Aquisphaera insulae]
MASKRVDRALSCLWFVAMGLIAAYGLVAMNEVLDSYEMTGWVITPRAPRDLPRERLLATVPLFAWWSVATLALGFIPREGRRTWRRPGLVPGMAVLLSAGRFLIEMAATNLRDRRRPPADLWQWLQLVAPRPTTLPPITHTVGLTVAATWFALWIAGWWHPAATWNDRAGRVLGLYWIAVCIIDPFHSWFM